jgi:hypothetical protein
MTKLIFANLIFFFVVVGGIMFASGNYQLFNMLGFNMGGDIGSGSQPNKDPKGGL